MKLVCSDYSGWKEVVTQLGAATEVFYRGDSSSTFTTLAIAYYSSGGHVIVFDSSGGVLISTLTTDYASASRIPGLQGVEV